MKKFDHLCGDYLSIGSAKIYYEVIGNFTGPVLLFLHGGFGNIEDFNDITAELAKTYKLIGIDSRGQGKSTLDAEELTYELLQSDVEKVLQHLNIDTLSILGFSDGGIIAYRLAALTKLNVETLITIGARWHAKNIEPIKEYLLQFTGESLRMQYPSFYETYDRLNPEPNFNHLTTQVIAMWLDARSSGCPNERIKSIECPMLVVRGETDPALSAADLDELSQRVKSAKLCTIAVAGHFAFQEQRQIFMEVLREFLG